MMRKVTEITCPCCSNGCLVRVDESGGNAVSGNRCSNGEAFAIHELTNPRRRVQGEIRLLGGAEEKLPVKLDRAVPLETLNNIAEALSGLTAEAPVYVSQVLARDVAGTGANLVACKSVPKAEPSEKTEE